MRIALLHTADVHIATFDQIFADLAPATQLDHHVHAALLDQARRDGVSAVRDETLRILTDLSSADAVLCTCSTLGPLADEAAITRPHIIRIDRPLMEQACKTGSDVLVAICLESTKDATLDLLTEVAGHPITATPVMCADAWSHFEVGDHVAYAQSIARAVTERLTTQSADCVVLAQASMRVAEPALSDIGIPVYSSPALAAARCIEVARANSEKGFVG